MLFPCMWKIWLPRNTTHLFKIDKIWYITYINNDICIVQAHLNKLAFKLEQTRKTSKIWTYMKKIYHLKQQSRFCDNLWFILTSKSNQKMKSYWYQYVEGGFCKYPTPCTDLVRKYKPWIADASLWFRSRLLGPYSSLAQEIHSKRRPWSISCSARADVCTGLNTPFGIGFDNVSLCGSLSDTHELLDSQLSFPVRESRKRWLLEMQWGNFTCKFFQSKPVKFVTSACHTCETRAFIDYLARDSYFNTVFENYYRYLRFLVKSSCWESLWVHLSV